MPSNTLNCRELEDRIPKCTCAVRAKTKEDKTDYACDRIIVIWRPAPYAASTFNVSHVRTDALQHTEWRFVIPPKKKPKLFVAPGSSCYAVAVPISIGIAHRIFALRLANGSSVPAKILSRILALPGAGTPGLGPVGTAPNGLLLPAFIVAGIVALRCGTGACCCSCCCCCCSGCSGIEGCVLYKANMLCLFILPVG